MKQQANLDYKRIYTSFFDSITSLIENPDNRQKIQNKWGIFQKLIDSNSEERLIEDYIESMSDFTKELYFLQVCQTNSTPKKYSMEDTRSTNLTNDEPKFRIDTIYELKEENCDFQKDESFITKRERYWMPETGRMRRYTDDLNTPTDRTFEKDDSVYGHEGKTYNYSTYQDFDKPSTNKDVNVNFENVIFCKID